MNLEEFSRKTEKKLREFYQKIGIKHTESDIQLHLDFIKSLSAKDIVLILPEDIRDKVIEKMKEGIDKEFARLAISFLTREKIVEIYKSNVRRSISLLIDRGFLDGELHKPAIGTFLSELSKVLNKQD